MPAPTRRDRSNKYLAGNALRLIAYRNHPLREGQKTRSVREIPGLTPAEPAATFSSH